MVDIRIRYGLFAGFLAMAYSSIIYTVDKKLLLEGYAAGTWLIMTVFMVLAGLHARRRTEGQFMSFRPLLQVIFPVFLIGELMLSFFRYYLYSSYDTSFAELVKQKQLKEFIESAQANPDLTDIALQEQIKQFQASDFIPTLASTLQGYVIYSIGGFVIACIVAGLLHRQRPNY